MSNVTIKFKFAGREITIQSHRDDKLQYIFGNFSTKLEIPVNQLYFLYDGKKIEDEEKKLSDIISNDTNIIIMAYTKDNNISNSEIPKVSKYLICPKCQTNCSITINNYRVELKKCENGHKTSDILLNQFENTQLYYESKIKCGECGSNKSATFKNQFYKCFNCNIYLCPLCKSKHNDDHNIIDYDFIPYRCHIHKDEKFISYCKTCNKNLCMICESEHNNSHRLTYFKDFLVNKNNINLNEFNEKVSKLEDEIQNYITKFKEFLLNIKTFSKIITHIDRFK